MKLTRSIRWRLQLWYGLILLVVLAGFGVTAARLEWNRQLGRVDDELHRRFAILAGALRPGRPPRQAGPPPPREAGPPFEGSPGPGPDDLPRNGPPPRFELPPWAAGLFGTNQAESFYFVITSLAGREIASSGKNPEPAAEAERDSHPIPPGQPTEPNGPNPPPAFTANGFREILDHLPSGETILVGGSLQPEWQDIHHTMLSLAAVGALILLVGLAGGWWISSRAIRPIADIGAAALKISAGDLSQRINVAETESELGQMAAVLNSTFARLETAFAQQKHFAADAAHELRTPVSVLLTQVQTALSRERSAGDYRETLEACQRAAQRMRRLIESLLALARFDAGQETLRRTRFDLARVIAEGVELVKPLAETRKIGIVADSPPLEMDGDVQRLGQVVANLLVNAIQFSGDGGVVRVTARREDGFTILSVADTGQGIAPADLPHVFERFYRADKSRTGGSAGLGLAIGKAIVEAHGGTIEVSSQAGSGTTFTVRLPV